MTFSRVNPMGWGLFEILTSGQMTDLDINMTFALDGRAGGPYSPSAELILDGTQTPAGTAIFGLTGPDGNSASSIRIQKNGADDSVAIDVNVLGDAFGMVMGPTGNQSLSLAGEPNPMAQITGYGNSNGAGGNALNLVGGFIDTGGTGIAGDGLRSTGGESLDGPGSSGAGIIATGGIITNSGTGGSGVGLHAIGGLVTTGIGRAGDGIRSEAGSNVGNPTARGRGVAGFGEDDSGTATTPASGGAGGEFFAGTQTGASGAGGTGVIGRGGLANQVGGVGGLGADLIGGLHTSSGIGGAGAQLTGGTTATGTGGVGAQVTGGEATGAGTGGIGLVATGGTGSVSGIAIQASATGTAILADASTIGIDVGATTVPSIGIRTEGSSTGIEARIEAGQTGNAVSGIASATGGFGVQSSTGATVSASNGAIRAVTTGGATGLAIATSTNNGAHINFDSTTPPSPANGDFWFNGAALFIRIAGVTKTVTVT